jgi:hypothetical protein
MNTRLIALVSTTVFVAVLALSQGVARAADVTVSGSTTGAVTGVSQLTFAGNTSFTNTTFQGVGALSGANTLGTFFLSTAPQQAVSGTFTLNITFTAPTGIAGGQGTTYTATVQGNVSPNINQGGVSITFNQPSQVFTFNNGVSGAFSLTLANVFVQSGQSANLSAGIKSSTLPEAAAWTLISSTLQRDEDSLSRGSLNEFEFAFDGANTGTITARANLTLTEGISAFCPAGSSVVNVSFTDSDGAALNAQVFFEIRRTNIQTGGNTVVYTFDSNAPPPATVSGLDFDFTNNVYWIEVKLKRTSSTQTVKLGAVQIYEASGPACP